jgi:predicted  nucleic acid-binding Zn-ribbon protein
VLAAQHEALLTEVSALRGDLGERNQRIRVLEAQLLEANQRRQDTCKWIDELIAQLDQLDAQLASAEPSE